MPIEHTDALAELLPCPFCGCDELSHGWSAPGIDGSATTGEVQCHGCDALLWKATEAEAITAWNTRHPPAIDRDAVADAEEVGAASFQQRVGVWAETCFPPKVVYDRLERRDRFVEEALELAQTLPEFTAARAHALVDYVFSRPVGATEQEVGGASVTLAALCHAEGIDQLHWAEAELTRISSAEVIEKIRAKQAAKPVGSALPIALRTANTGRAEVLEEARAVLALAAKVPIADPFILVELRALCERAGYGNVMSSASALWRERLGDDLAGGEFASGPCRTTVEKAIAAIDAALSSPPVTTAPDPEIASEDGWQPIETAPRDGAWFLACSNTPGWGATRIVHFKYPDDRLPIHGEGVMWPSAPTHWRPLPPPPTPQAIAAETGNERADRSGADRGGA